LNKLQKRFDDEFKPPVNIKFENVDQKEKILKEINNELLKVNVSLDIIKPENRENLSDLVDELNDLIKAKTSLQSQIETITGIF